MSDSEPKRELGSNFLGNPLTKREIIQRARNLFGSKSRGPNQKHDRWTLFAEWIRSDHSQFRNSGQWIKARHPEVNPATMASAEWGGYTFWNLAREAFHREAMAKVIEKSPYILAKSIEKGLKATSTLHDTVMRMARRIEARMDKDETDDKALEAGAIHQLAEAVQLLNENLRLFSGGMPQKEGSVNIVNVVAQQLRERNGKYGVKD